MTEMVEVEVRIRGKEGQWVSVQGFVPNNLLASPSPHTDKVQDVASRMVGTLFSVAYHNAYGRVRSAE